MKPVGTDVKLNTVTAMTLAVNSVTSHRLQMKNNWYDIDFYEVHSPLASKHAVLDFIQKREWSSVSRDKNWPSHSSGKAHKVVNLGYVHGW